MSREIMLKIKLIIIMTLSVLVGQVHALCEPVVQHTYNEYTGALEQEILAECQQYCMVAQPSEGQPIHSCEVRHELSPSVIQSEMCFMTMAECNEAVLAASSLNDSSPSEGSGEFIVRDPPTSSIAALYGYINIKFICENGSILAWAEGVSSKSACEAIGSKFKTWHVAAPAPIQIAENPNVHDREVDVDLNVDNNTGSNVLDNPVSDNDLSATSDVDRNSGTSSPSTATYTVTGGGSTYDSFADKDSVTSATEKPQLSVSN